MIMKKEVLNYYLYISWDKKNQDQEFLSYMMVAKTMVREELSEEIQVIGDNMFVFSSTHSFQELRDKLKHKRFPYMLIDITMSMSLGLLSMYLQESEIEALNEFVDNSNKNQLDYFNLKLQDCLYNEDYENAAKYRDLISSSN